MSSEEQQGKKHQKYQKYREDIRAKQTNLTFDMGCFVLRQGDLPVCEALELCSRLREHFLENFPGQDEVFDTLFAPRLRRILHEIYD